MRLVFLVAAVLACSGFATRQRSGAKAKMEMYEEMLAVPVTHRSLEEDAETWAVVHSKVPASLAALLQQDPKKTTVKDDIWKMGKEMCKDTPDKPNCKQFFDDEKKEEEEEAVAATAAPPAAAPAVAPAVAPAEVPAASSPAPAPAVNEAAAPAPAPVAAAPVAANETAKEVEPQKLQAQGFRGKPVAHVDGETQVSDWRDEYAVATTTTPKPVLLRSDARAPGLAAAACILVFLHAALPALL